MATSVLDDLINTHGRPLDNGGTILPNSGDDQAKAWDQQHPWGERINNAVISIEKQ